MNAGATSVDEDALPPLRQRDDRRLSLYNTGQVSRMMTRMANLTSKGREGNARGTWAVAEAKARFSEVIDRALANGPQTITRKGQKAVVVVSAEEWQCKTKRKGNLAEFFAASPMRGSGLKIKRTKNRPREVKL